MAKLIKVYRSSTPDNPVYGYGDHVMVFDERGSNIYGAHCSSCPDPFRISDHASWQDVFAMLDCQEITWECMANDPAQKMGKCLCFNGGGKCSTVNRNSNHNGEEWAASVYFHVGGIHSQNPEWRASEACLTIHPKDAPNFFDLFQVGETGTLTLENLINNQEATA